MKQLEFVQHAKQIFERNDHVVGLLVGGSWLNNQLDEFSDVDLIVVTDQRITDDKDKMVEYAKQLGNFLSGFTGEHVGEPRLLICLYDRPLLHVDLKFLTLVELAQRVENPVILFDKTGELQEVLKESKAEFPHPDFQWIEDRFWIWVHYTLVKIGRGEYFEALDFFGFLRMRVLGPLLQLKNNRLPRGVRKVETELSVGDLEFLKSTIPNYDKQSLLKSLKNAISLYRILRTALFGPQVCMQTETEQRVMDYFDEF